MAFADDFSAALSNLQGSTSGVDTSYTPPTLTGFQAPTPTPLNLPSWNLTPSDFSGGSPSAAPSVGSGGGFWGNIWNGIKSGVGNVFNLADQVGAGFRNATNDVLNIPQNIIQSFQNGSAPSSESFGSQLMSALGNQGQQFAQGYQNPSQAVTGRQYFDNAVLGGKDIPVASAVGGFSADMATNPLTYVPVPIGKIAEVTQLAPAVRAGINALKGTPVLNNKVINGIGDTLGNLFSKNYGANPDLVNILNNREAEHSANQYNIINSLGGLAKNHGMSNDELNNIGHLMEGTQEATPLQDQLVSKLQDLRDNGVPNSTSTGTNALTSTMGPDGKPLLQTVLPNYYPHIYRNTPTELQGVFPKSGYGVPGLSPNGTYQLPRTFATLADAQAKGLKPEMNPFMAIGEHLSNSSKAVTNARAIEDIKNTPGILFAKDPIDEMKKLVQTGRVGSLDEAAQQLGMKPEDLKQGFVQSKVPQLSGSYIRPADEAAVRNYLEPVAKNSVFDKGMGVWKQASTFNSLVHGHNILYNGMYLGGAKPEYVADAFKNIKSGTDDPWLQRAMKAGAVSADRGGFMNNLSKAIAAPKSIPGQVWNKMTYAFHGALWDLDKALRTSIFRQAVEGGATDTEAAAKANKFLTNYNNLTPFEQRVMTRIFPFYTWMKGNMPLQVEQWITNTPKQTLYEVAKNSVAQGLTGQNMTQDGKIDTGIKLSDGSHVLVDPYSPADEPLKMAQQGPLAFLYGKINPLAKEGIDQLANHAYYPGGPLAPSGKQSMADIPITKPGLPESVNVGSSLAHAFNSVVPLSGPIGGTLGNLVGGSDSRGIVDRLAGLPSKQKPGMTGTELLTKALGGFTSRDNPLLDQYYQQRDAQAAAKNQIGYNKQTGQGVPKSLKSQAYKKIPYPGP